jgi:hypothetical protein
MAAPINSFELVESIRFFASLVGTEGLSEDNNRLGNEYINKLLLAMEPAVREATATASGLHIS